MTPDALQSRRKLPAYGSKLLAIRLQGLVPARSFMLAHVVVALDTWRLGRSATWRLVIALEDDPVALDFSPIAGLDVLLAYDARRSDRARVAATVEALLQCQPNELVALDVARSHEPKIIKAPALGVERARFP